MKERVTIEIGKIRGSLERLWNLSRKEKLDRNECLNTIREIDRSLNAIITFFGDNLTKRFLEISPEKLLINETIYKAFTGKSITAGISEKLASLKTDLIPYSLSSTMHQLENPTYYKDEDVKRSITNFCKDLEKGLLLLEDMLGLKSGLLRIAEFSSEFPSFTENWIVGVVYLSAMEIGVKRALTKRGKEIKEKFKDNVTSLISHLKDEEVPIQSLEELLPPVFWDLRNKVIHEGYSPTHDELEMIIKYVTSFMRKIE